MNYQLSTICQHIPLNTVSLRANYLDVFMAFVAFIFCTFISQTKHIILFQKRFNFPFVWISGKQKLIYYLI